MLAGGQLTHSARISHNRYNDNRYSEVSRRILWL